MSPMSPWGDILTEQLRGDILIDQQQEIRPPLTGRALALRMPATSSWRNGGARSASGWDRTARRSWERISMSNESLLVILLVGLIAGWLAGHFVRGTGYGLIADIAIGIVGALIGSWLLPRFGLHLGAGIVPAMSPATFGAAVRLITLRCAYSKARC